MNDQHLILLGNASRLPFSDRSVHCCITSPPYWGLRDYGNPDQLGLERTPCEYINRLVGVFQEVRRVLRDDGTLWLNLGDTYSNQGGKGTGGNLGRVNRAYQQRNHRTGVVPGLKAKDMVGIPWLVAFALRDDGWYLRSELIWEKPNCMVGSQRDRPTRSHEQVFLLSKKPRYYYDAFAVRERSAEPNRVRSDRFGGATGHTVRHGLGSMSTGHSYRNRRSVWRVNTVPFRGAHFAAFPPKLIVPMIKAGTSERGCCPSCGAPWRRLVEKDRVPTRPAVQSKTYLEPPVHADSPLRSHHGDVCGNRDPRRHVTTVRTIDWEPSCRCEVGDPIPCTCLDPFGGVMTTSLAAASLSRSSVCVELNPEYVALGKERLAGFLHPREKRPARVPDLPGQRHFAFEEAGA